MVLTTKQEKDTDWAWSEIVCLMTGHKRPLLTNCCSLGAISSCHCRASSVAVIYVRLLKELNILLLPKLLFLQGKSKQQHNQVGDKISRLHRWNALGLCTLVLSVICWQSQFIFQTSLLFPDETLCNRTW
jgi:hypothetical protein